MLFVWLQYFVFVFQHLFNVMELPNPQIVFKLIAFVHLFIFSFVMNSVCFFFLLSVYYVYLLTWTA